MTYQSAKILRAIVQELYFISFTSLSPCPLLDKVLGRTLRLSFGRNCHKSKQGEIKSILTNKASSFT